MADKSEYLPIENKARLIAERVFDVLWHNEVLKEDITILDIRHYLTRDLIDQLEEFYNEDKDD